MKKAQIIFIVLILIVLAGIVVAECDLETITDESYQNLDCYNNPDFYRNSDPNKWDYTNNNVYDFLRNNPEYYQKIDYNSPNLDYSQLDYRNVDYSQANQNRMDVRRYMETLGCNNCEYVLERGSANLNASGIQHQNGDFVSIPGNYPAGTTFKITQEGIEVWLPRDANAFIPPTSDTVTVISLDETTLPDGSTFKGDLTFVNGQANVIPGRTAIVNNIEIDNSQASFPEESERGISPISVYFDGQPHSEDQDYISFGETQMIINNNQQTRISFLPGNSYFNVERNDELTFRLSGTLAITNRDSQNLVPQLIASRDLGGYITNGNNFFTIYDGRVVTYAYNSGDPAGSVPMIFIGENAQNVLFDDHNNFLVFPEGLSESLQCYNCNYNIERNSLFTDFVSEKIRTLSPNLQLSGQQLTIRELSLFYSILSDLPPNVLDAVHEIEIIPNDRLEEVCGENSGACAPNQKIVLPIGYAGDASIIYHEAAHALTYQIVHADPEEYLEQELSEQYGAPVRIAAHLQDPNRTYGGHPVMGCDLPPENCELRYRAFLLHDEGGVREITLNPDDEGTLFHALVAEERQNFIQVWTNVAGGEEVYGANLGERTVAGYNAVVWADGTSGPRNGCVRAYGCNNALEDIATYVEYANNPSFWQPLVTQSSPQYDPRYRQKLDFLLQYGFINQNQYSNIVGEGE